MHPPTILTLPDTKLYQTTQQAYRLTDRPLLLQCTDKSKDANWRQIQSPAEANV